MTPDRLPSTGGGSASRNALVLAAGMAAAAVFGLLFQALLSNYFGAGAETDAFFMSVSIFAFLSKFMMLGALKSIALPVYQNMDSGTSSASADRRLGGLVRLVLLALSAATVVLVLAAPFLVRLLAPGFDAEASALTTRLLRIRLPALALTAALTVGLVGLEAKSRFGLSVTANKVVPAIAAFVGLLWVTDRFGIRGVAWIGLASTVAGFVFLVSRWPRLFAGSAREAAQDPRVRGIGRRWLRFSQSTLATMAGEWAFRIGASLLPVGLFSAVLYGRRVHDVLHGAINDSVNTVTLPELARAAQGARGAQGDRGDQSEANTDDTVGLRLRARVEALVAISLPLAAMTILSSEWIVAVLFGRGRFLSDGMSGPTGVALSIYVVGFLIQGVNQLCYTAAYATDRSGLVNRVQTIGHGVRAVILIPLALWVGYVGLVAGQVFMNALVFAMALTLWPQGLRLGVGWLVSRLGRIIGIATVPLGLLWLGLERAGDPHAYGLIARLGILAAACTISFVAYAALAHRLGVRLPRLPWMRAPQA